MTVRNEVITGIGLLRHQKQHQQLLGKFLEFGFGETLWPWLSLSECLQRFFILYKFVALR